jgi:hypothetical protein
LTVPPVTDAMRERVQRLSGVGVPQDDIADIIDCDPKTLRKHFPNELRRGVAEANVAVASYLFAKAKEGHVTAQIFWLKTRARWREGRALEDPVPGAEAGSNSYVVILPDNGRDPEEHRGAAKGASEILCPKTAAIAAVKYMIRRMIGRLTYQSFGNTVDSTVGTG